MASQSAMATATSTATQNNNKKSIVATKYVIELFLV